MMLENSCDTESQTVNALTTESLVIFLSTQIRMDLLLMNFTRRRQLEVACEMEGTGFNLAKRESDNISSSFDDTRRNLFPSYSMTHAEGGMQSNGSNQVSLSSQLLQASDSKERGRRPVKVWHHSRNIRLMVPQRKNTECLQNCLRHTLAV